MTTKHSKRLKTADRKYQKQLEKGTSLRRDSLKEAQRAQNRKHVFHEVRDTKLKQLRGGSQWGGRTGVWGVGGEVTSGVQRQSVA